MKKLDEKLLHENINKIAEYDLSRNNVFGLSYLVCQDGKEIFKGHFGSYGEEGKPLDEKAIFRLASMSKPVAGFATLMLIDKGLIHLNDEVKKYIPSFDGIHVVDAQGKDCGKCKTEPTILHLLTHSSGFGCGKFVALCDSDRETIEALVERFARAGLDFEPFSTQAYSAVASSDALAYIVEKVTGRDYEEFLQTEIFAPCGMHDTTFVPNEEMWERFVTMHAKENNKSVVGDTSVSCVFENFPATHKLAGAGLASTLVDYSAFAQMLLNRGETNGKRLVDDKTFDLFGAPHVPRNVMGREDESWGFGVRVITCANNTLPEGTYGWSGAYGSHFWVDPQNNITAVFMKNSRFDGGAGNKSAVRFEKAVYDSFNE